MGLVAVCGGASAATYHGYGEFLGTYYKNNGQPTITDFFDATTTGYLVDAPDIDPVTGVNTGGLGLDPSELTPWNSAGHCEVTNQASGASSCEGGSNITIDVDGGSKTGTWTYTGVTGFEPVDLFIVTKYDSAFSIFRYGFPPGVTTGDWGSFTTDPDVFGGIGGCLPEAWGSPRTDGFRDDCFRVSEGGPMGLSNVTAYWPAITQVPLPPAAILLGTAIAGVLGAAGIRRGAPSKRASS